MLEKNKIKIVIIEDELVLRENIQELLTMVGYHIETANNGEEGLNLILSFHPDLILCDIKMPKKDGYELLVELRGYPDHHNIPFIFFSAKVEKKDVRYAMNLGADDYLTKPFSKEELLAAIDSRFKRSQQIQDGMEAQNENSISNLSLEDGKLLREPLSLLTKMEKKILCEIARGMNTKEISCKFFISTKTIENHRFNIGRKLGLRGTNGVLSFALMNRVYLLKKIDQGGMI